MNVQIIERDGRPEYAVVPIAEYRRLAEAAEMLRDIEDYDRVKARLACGEEELVPAEVVSRLADGEHPLKVWRDHRRMTQAQLASAAGIGQSYVAMLERGGRRGSIGRLRALARALGVELGDLLGDDVDE